MKCGKELGRKQYKFCSSSCAAKYNNHARGKLSNETKEKISKTLSNHNKKTEKHISKKEHYCLQCGKELKQKQYKFCSLDCCHKHNIKDKSQKFCLMCGNELSPRQKKFCSTLCCSEHSKRERLKKYFNGEYYINPNSSIPHFLREYLLEKSDYKCELCGYSGFNRKTHNTVLQIHHIDGDSRNNNIDNLQVLCPNCHAETENFMALNKNKSGRTKRYLKK